jgi:hypothetical protein
LKRLSLAAGVTLAISFAGVANAKPVTTRHARLYAHLYHHVAMKFGHRTPGRNIVRWGMAPSRPATDSQVITSIGVLERMLAPPPAPVLLPVAPPAVPQPVAESPVPPVTDPVTQASAPAPTPAPTGSPLPTCTWQPESGGNPSAVNPSSGAGGYYQILPSTWSAYGGTGAPQDAPMSEQTAIAQKIYQSQGPGAWNNC